MAKVPETYQAGDTSNLTVEQLYLIILDMYKDLAIAVNKKPDIYIRDVNGDTADTFLNIGDININAGTVEMLTSHPTISTVTWTTIS